jgi:hypothetical protein
MDDSFLNELRREPAPEFARRLRTSLQRQEFETQGGSVGMRAPKWAALAASIVLVSIAFTLPSVRAGAQAFLDLFRVVNIAGVSFNAARLNELDLNRLDLPKIVGQDVEVLIEAGEPISYATLDEAGAAAGLRLLSPAWVPTGWERAEIVVCCEHAARVTANTQLLRVVLDELAIDDIAIPTGLDGQTLTVRIAPVVTTSYRNGQRVVQLFQSRSPEVSFPAGLDLPVLAEIGLRIIGLDRDEAYRVAQSVDWRSTLIVPVPATEATFREVNVAGADGLMIVPEGRPGALVLLWASGDQVFALTGPLQPAELLEMAQTLQ